MSKAWVVAGLAGAAGLALAACGPGATTKYEKAGYAPPNSHGGESHGADSKDAAHGAPADHSKDGAPAEAKAVAP
jgi:hypothetical protein